MASSQIVKEVVIGIDLGTTYSVVAVYKDDKVNIIHNDQGNYTTPSCVSFTETERFIGEPALDRALIDPTNTIIGVKRFLGRTYDDEEFQRHLPNYLYSIINIKNKPKIKVTYKKKVYRYAPEEISAMILETLKNLAKNYLNIKPGEEVVTKAVITVPAHFNDAQRQATKIAGKLAGLEVIKIINEPTAAALAHGLHSKYEQNPDSHTILVYDFGGGTFDVSIITLEKNVFDVITTKGEAYLGGDDIDTNLVKFFVKEFQKKHKVDLHKDNTAIRRLRQKCEKLKKSLSFAENATIDIEAIYRL